LALVGSMASDDPEGWDFFNATIAHAGGDPDIHILNNFNNVGAIEVNAFQSHSDVVLQKSTREGFGLTVTEALWKGRPFVGGNVGGIPLQVDNGLSGYLVSDVEACAERCLDILRDPALGKALGRRGKEHVRKHFLTPRYLRDYLRIFGELLEAAPQGGDVLVRLVESDPDAYDRFYNVFANPMLWFIQHYLWDLSNAPDIRRHEIEAFEFGYNVVNEDLARAVLEEIEGEREPVVMVHDYHLYTLPALVRQARPDVFLHHFVHIPWTQPDAWRVLPSRIREEI